MVVKDIYCWLWTYKAADENTAIAIMMMYVGLVIWEPSF